MLWNLLMWYFLICEALLPVAAVAFPFYLLAVWIAYKRYGYVTKPV